MFDSSIRGAPMARGGLAARVAAAHVAADATAPALGGPRRVSPGPASSPRNLQVSSASPRGARAAPALSTSPRHYANARAVPAPASARRGGNARLAHAPPCVAHGVAMEGAPTLPWEWPEWAVKNERPGIEVLLTQEVSQPRWVRAEPVDLVIHGHDCLLCAQYPWSDGQYYLEDFSADEVRRVGDNTTVRRHLGEKMRAQGARPRRRSEPPAGALHTDAVNRRTPAAASRQRLKRRRKSCSDLSSCAAADFELLAPNAALDGHLADLHEVYRGLQYRNAVGFKHDGLLKRHEENLAKAKRERAECEESINQRLEAHGEEYANRMAATHSEELVYKEQMDAHITHRKRDRDECCEEAALAAKKQGMFSGSGARKKVKEFTEKACAHEHELSAMNSEHMEATIERRRHAARALQKHHAQFHKRNVETLGMMASANDKVNRAAEELYAYKLSMGKEELNHEARINKLRSKATLRMHLNEANDARRAHKSEKSRYEELEAKHARTIAEHKTELSQQAATHKQVFDGQVTAHLHALQLQMEMHHEAMSEMKAELREANAAEEAARAEAKAKHEELVKAEASRLAVLGRPPLQSPTAPKIPHLGSDFRHDEPQPDSMRLRSRPALDSAHSHYSDGPVRIVYREASSPGVVYSDPHRRSMETPHRSVQVVTSAASPVSGHDLMLRSAGSLMPEHLVSPEQSPFSPRSHGSYIADHPGNGMLDRAGLRASVKHGIPAHLASPATYYSDEDDSCHPRLETVSTTDGTPSLDGRAASPRAPRVTVSPPWISAPAVRYSPAAQEAEFRYASPRAPIIAERGSRPTHPALLSPGAASADGNGGRREQHPGHTFSNAWHHAPPGYPDPRHMYEHTA